MKNQESIPALILSALMMNAVSVEANSIPQRKKPVQRRAESQAQKRVDPKIGCAATGGASKMPLLAAAYYGDLATLENLLAKGTDVNLKDNYGRTALLVAANHAHTAVVKFLLGNGADPNPGSDGGHTPLMYAACLADVESVKALLEKGADVNANDSAALVWIGPKVDGVKEDERDQILRLFFAKGVKVPAEAIIGAASGNNLRKMNELLSRNPDTKAKSDEGNTALHVASEYGSPEIAQALLAKGAAINEKNNDGMTPLMIAVEAHRLAMVEVLLNSGADVNVKDNDGETALDYAKDGSSDSAIIGLLRQARSGNRSNTPYAADDIFSLVRKGDLTKIQELLRKNPSFVNTKDESGATPLHHAAGKSVEMIKVLVANKADVNARDKNGVTPLHIAAHGSSSFDVVKALLEGGADPNANNGADIPFHYAIFFGQIDVVKLMLDYKADVTIKNRGQTPIQLARGKPEIIKLLRARGAK